PYNVAAHKGREEVAIQKDRAALAGFDATRAMAMWEIDKEWTRPYKHFDRTKGIEFQTVKRQGGPTTVQITKKLNSIIIPKIDFKDSTVREAVDFLVKKSKDLDPEGQGVNIVLKLGEEAGIPAPAAPP